MECCNVFNSKVNCIYANKHHKCRCGYGQCGFADVCPWKGTVGRKEIVMKPDDLPPKGTSEEITKETYTMLFKCTNCGTEFLREVEKGRYAWDLGGTCPYCNVKDGAVIGKTFGYRKPPKPYTSDGDYDCGY